MSRSRIPSPAGFVLLLCLLCLASAHAQESGTILFIRGGSGTGGFFEGFADNNLCSIFDESEAVNNKGWGTLRQTLESGGFATQEVAEGPAANNTPIPLESMDLAQYAIIVFGSNNAEYGPAAVDAVVDYLRGGGAALFISDANFGSDWDDASDSDQHFLDRFGWKMQQDNGTYDIDSGEYLVPDHPILAGVGAFHGEGVTPITLVDTTLTTVTSTILALAKGDVRRNGLNENPGNNDQGATTPATPDDAALIVARVAGGGRIAGHFDRNTFFNDNGQGSDITRFDNLQYAVQLYDWLSQAGPETRARGWVFYD